MSGQAAAVPTETSDSPGPLYFVPENDGDRQRLDVAIDIGHDHRDPRQESGVRRDKGACRRRCGRTSPMKAPGGKRQALRKLSGIRGGKVTDRGAFSHSLAISFGRA